MGRDFFVIFITSFLKFLQDSFKDRKGGFFQFWDWWDSLGILETVSHFPGIYWDSLTICERIRIGRFKDLWDYFEKSWIGILSALCCEFPGSYFPYWFNLTATIVGGGGGGRGGGGRGEGEGGGGGGGGGNVIKKKKEYLLHHVPNAITWFIPWQKDIKKHQQDHRNSPEIKDP